MLNSQELPSFLYSGLDHETYRLAKELEALGGGGDAKVESIKLHAILSDGLEQDDPQTPQVLWSYGTSVGIRDVYKPRSAPMTETMKCYPVSSTTTNREILSSTSQSGIVRQALDTVKDGFNACLVATGGVTCNKSQVLFGPADSELPQMHTHLPNCLAAQLLKGCFNDHRSKTSSRTGPREASASITIALSAWGLQSNTAVDLLSSSTSSAEVAYDFVLVECPDIFTAWQVLLTARQRANLLFHHRESRSGSASPRASQEVFPSDQSIQPDHNLYHFFLRIVIFTEHLQGPLRGETCTASLYLVDLISAAPTDDILVHAEEFHRLSEADKISRRENNLQLLSLHKLLAELRASNKSISAESDTSLHLPNYGRAENVPTLRVTSGRDSKLTSILAPIIQGNCVTSILMFLADGERHYHTSRSTILAYEGVTEILCPLYKVKNISRSNLKLRSHGTVLSVQPLQRSSDFGIGINSILESGGHYHSQTDDSSSTTGTTRTSLDLDAVNLEQLAASEGLQMYYKSPKRSHSKGAADITNSAIKVAADLSHDDSDRGNPSLCGNDSDDPISELAEQPTSNVKFLMGEFHELMAQMQGGESLADKLKKQAAVDNSRRSYLANDFLETERRTTDRTLERIYDTMDLRDEVLGPFSRHSGTLQLGGSERPAFNALAGALLDHLNTGTSSGGLAHESSHSSSSGMGEDSRSVVDLYSIGSHAINNTSTLDAFDTTPLPQPRVVTGTYERSEYAHDENVSHAAAILAKSEMAIEQLFSPSKQDATVTTNRTGGRRSSSPVRVGVVSKESDSESWMRRTATSELAGLHDSRQVSGIGSSLPDDMLPVSHVSLYQSYNSNSNNKHDPLLDITPKLRATGTAAGIRHSGVLVQTTVDHMNLVQDSGPKRSISPTITVKHRNGASEGANEIHSSPPRIYARTPTSGSKITSKGSAGNSPLNQNRVRSSSGSISPNRSTPSSTAKRSTTYINPADSVSSSGRTRMPSTSVSNTDDGQEDGSSGSVRRLRMSDGGENTSVTHINQLTAELETIKNVQSSLMEALQEERQKRTVLEGKLSQAQEEALEIKMQSEVEISSYHVEIKRLKNQTRALVENAELSEVFTPYEETMRRLVKENQTLRERNLQLEAHHMDMATKYGTSLLPALTGLASGEDGLDQHCNIDHSSSAASPAVKHHHNNERARLLGKLKRTAVEKELITQAFEELQRKERQFLLGNKIAQDASRRLRFSYQECEKLKKQLEDERMFHATKDRDLNLLREEFKGVQESERILREERSRTLAELALLRDRVRELENEKRSLSKLNRFVSKHSSPPATQNSISGGAVTVDHPSSSVSHNYLSLGQDALQRKVAQQHHHQLIQGLAGSHNAEYLRLEEQLTMHPDLEDTLSAFHEYIVAKQPSLLPLFRRLSDEMHKDRTRWLEEKNRLLGMVLNRAAAAVKIPPVPTTTTADTSTFKENNAKLSPQNVSSTAPLGARKTSNFGAHSASKKRVHF